MALSQAGFFGSAPEENLQDCHGGTADAGCRSMRKFKIYLVIFAVVLSSIVIAQNTDVVETKILFMTISMPRAGLLILTLAVGALIGAGLTLILGRNKNRPDLADEQ